MLIKLCEVDLRKPIQSIYVDHRYSRLFLVVTWGYLPLGLVQMHCPPDERTIPHEKINKHILEALGWKLWEYRMAGNLKDLNDIPEQFLPPISVIVCTRDHALSLRRCLKALSELDYPTYEVVIIDNCSRDDSVARVAEQFAVRYAREDRPGLDWARNRGIQESQFDIIAYIDDDALATPGWLRGIAKGFAVPGVMAVTGMVLPAEIETAAQNEFEIYGGMNKGFAGYTIHRNHLKSPGLFWANNWGVGTNMAFRRDLFEAIGNFDVALDVGTPTNGAGDIEYFYRTVSSGYPLCYEPAARVYHVHRRDRPALMQQIYNNGRSFPAYLMTIARNNPGQRWGVLWFGLRWWLWGWLLKRLMGSILKRDKLTMRFAYTELKGVFSALPAYRRSRQLARKQ